MARQGGGNGPDAIRGSAVAHNHQQPSLSQASGTFQASSGVRRHGFPDLLTVDLRRVFDPLLSPETPCSLTGGGDLP